ncbi:MAG: deoxyribose-phosphate aldolase [Duncaniella sp.]|nr:deoxyribose-phosphate aldolase [Bacteroides sp.]MDE6066333.1 deoxyribose-phosphate aldolase [Duncaniella sp.]
MDKYHQAIAESEVITDDAAITEKVNEILDKHLEENRKPEVLRQLFNCIDLTTLKPTDSQQSVANFTERVNAFEEEHPDLPNVAAICVYPNLVPIVRTVLDVSSVDIASVAGCFPSGQSFIEVKMAEIALAVEAGADEIDIVFPLGDYLDNDYEEVADQISEMKHACRESLLKVILETGALKSALHIRNASILSLYSGADFLKTSTGKEYPGASLEAAYVMCRCIKEYYAKTQQMVGFKVSGGVATTEDALKYYTIVKEVLGDKWVGSNEYFRIGASRLANNLLTDIIGTETKFF